MFGNNGAVTVYTDGSSAWIEDLVLRPDGSIVVAVNDMLFRLDALGRLDAGFDGDGMVDLNKGLLAVEPGPGGSLVSLTGGPWELQRHTHTGQADTGFGQRGTFRPEYFDASVYSVGTALAIEPDGKIVIAGASGANIGLLRLLPDGQLDTGFGNKGFAAARKWVHTGEISFVMRQPDGGFVQIIHNSDRAVEVVRLTATGQRDTSFGQGGASVVPVGTLTLAKFTGAMRADGKFVVAATVYPAAGESGWARTKLLAFNADGSPDLNFGAAGLSTLSADPTAATEVNAVAWQADGKLVVAGAVLHHDRPDNQGDTLLARLNADGSMDASFGQNGWVVFNTAVDDVARSVAVQADGKILVGGGSGKSAVLWRFNPDGSFDNDTGAPPPDPGLPNVGTPGNDVLHAQPGDDFIDGGAGRDTLVVSGARSQYLLYDHFGRHLADTVEGRDGSDLLANIERIQFTDGFLALDIGGNGGRAYRLYQAAFDRTPDVGGLGFQINALDSGHTLLQVAQNFIDSPEFAGRYGALNDLQFVTQLYANVLDRAPDEGGLAYHTGNLAAGMSRAQVLVGFSESPENQANVIGAIENGIFYTL